MVGARQSWYSYGLRKLRKFETWGLSRQISSRRIDYSTASLLLADAISDGPSKLSLLHRLTSVSTKGAGRTLFPPSRCPIQLPYLPGTYYSIQGLFDSQEMIQRSPSIHADGFLCFTADCQNEAPCSPENPLSAPTSSPLTPVCLVL
jgi:hypothetical protein